jgi:hypothetical protein
MAVSRINEAGLNINQYGNRNLIINGAMQVAQRGSVADLQTGYGACDRFRLASNSAARFDTSQSTDVPSGQGFSKSLKLDCSTADTSLAAGDYYLINYMIEGQNLQQLLYGSSSAKQCTLSFWVKSPKTGTHNLEIESVDGGVFNIHQYTISSANTWQNVKITFDGYQTTAIANDNTSGLVVNWWLLAGTTFSGGSYSANTWTSTNANRAVGQVNVADSTSNDFYLTGVQLEVGDTATDFEHRTFDDERERCERYFQKWDVEAAVGAGLWYTVSIVLAHLNFRKIMRTSPTMSVSSADFVKAYRPNASIDSASGTNFDVININSARFNLTMASNGTAGEGAMVQVRPSEYIHADAEL